MFGQHAADCLEDTPTLQVTEDRLADDLERVQQEFSFTLTKERVLS